MRKFETPQPSEVPRGQGARSSIESFEGWRAFQHWLAHGGAAATAQRAQKWCEGGQGAAKCEGAEEQPLVSGRVCAHLHLCKEGGCALHLLRVIGFMELGLVLVFGVGVGCYRAGACAGLGL